MYAVLAGGESKRFGKDKLIALVEGRPVIERVLEEVGPDHVMLTVSEERCKLYGGKRCVYDEGRGPAWALLKLETAFTSLSGDLPWIEREVLERLEAFRRVFGAQVAVPLHGKGHLESLMISVEEIGNIKEKVLSTRVNRSYRVTDIIRAAEKVVFVGSGLLTRNPRVFAHVNTPTDLKVGAPKEPLGDKVIELNLGKGPCEDLEKQLKLFKSFNLVQLVKHVTKDMGLC